MSEEIIKDEAIFRSAEMSLIQFYIPQEMARDAVYTVGQLGLVQFVDLNHKIRAFQRVYVEDIRRLDNVQRQYNYFYKLLKKHGIKMLETEEDMLKVEVGGQVIVAPSSSTIDEYVQNATFLEDRLVQMEEAADSLEAQKADVEQYRAVLQAGDFFFSNDLYMPSNNNGSTLDDGDLLTSSGNFVTGVIPKEKVNILEQILWRMLRGNVYFKYEELPEPIYDVKANEKISKCAFIVFSPGDLIVRKIKKVAESLDAQLYEVDKSSNVRSQKLVEVNQRLGDLYTVLETTTNTLTSELYAISRELNKWYQDISCEKATFETLNKFNFDNNRKILIAEGWTPQDEIDILQAKLTEITKRLGIDVPSIIEVIETNRVCPTYHRTNKFTEAFQNICDCYGIAQYREVNAGLPTIVTFPFMFAIMFGDLGHGCIMFLAALTLVLNESKIDKMQRGEIFDMAYSGRYILLLMGLFSMYTGFLYNDIFSKSMTLFKSGWEWPSSWEEGETIVATSTGTYPIGLDWAWHGTENDLLFSNSYKMKLSILMGFIHMTYSYMFALVNHLHFHSVIDIIGNFIPGLLFMQCLFGYLSVCIVYKWSKDWIKDVKPAPGLLNMLINMFLAPGTIDDELYPHQAKVQVFLLIVAMICVPCLLLIKPLHFKFTHKEPTESNTAYHSVPTSNDQDHVNQSTASIQQNSVDMEQLQQLENIQEDLEDEEDNDGHSNAHGSETLGDVIIHQVIHTIEFCLNTVSHTASYLRLWALSLAHAQLSSVLWTMTIQIAFGIHGTIGVIATVGLFAAWFVLTCCVLVVMEGTSAMLHSLRLHWVESMSKFFTGDGTPYEPFQFQYAQLQNQLQ